MKKEIKINTKTVPIVTVVKDFLQIINLDSLLNYKTKLYRLDNYAPFCVCHTKP